MALILVISLLAGIYALWSLATASRWTHHGDTVRRTLRTALLDVTDAEASSRTYLIAGESLALQEYQAAIGTLEHDLSVLDELTADNLSQSTRLHMLARLLADHRAKLDLTLAAYRRGDRGEALGAFVRDANQSLNDIRSVFASMEKEEVGLDDARSAHELSRWRLTFALLSTGLGALLLMTWRGYRQRRATLERKLRDDETARSHELLQTILQGADVGITVQDLTGRLHYANHAAAVIIGFESAEQLLAASTPEVMARFEILSSDGTPFPTEQLPSRAAMRGESAPAVSIRFRRHGTRDLRTTELRSVPVRDSAGNVALVINFLREVTDAMRRGEQRAFLLRAVDELTSSLDYQRTLSTLTQMAVPGLADWCAIDLLENGAIKRVAVAHVDRSKLELVAEIERKYPPNPDAVTGVPQIIRSGLAEFVSEIPRELIQKAAIDAEHLRLIDSLQLGSYIGVPLNVRGATIGAITFAMAESDRRYMDTDKRFAEELAERAALAIDNARLFKELAETNAEMKRLLAGEQQRRAEAERASKFADLFTGILGHDLRNPLGAVTAGLELIKQRGTVDLKTLARLDRSTQRMNVMVSQLLDLARSRIGGGIVITRRELDLSAIVAQAVEELRLIFPSRRIDLECITTNGAWDGERLAQVVSNLVGNALEHSANDSPISVTLAHRDLDAVLSVHNKGPAIPADLLPRLFDPERLVTTRGDSSRGLGLGLFITQQIVHAHGGRVEATSTDINGTTFTVTLPIRHAEPTVAASN